MKECPENLNFQYFINFCNDSTDFYRLEFSHSLAHQSSLDEDSTTVSKTRLQVMNIKKLLLITVMIILEQMAESFARNDRIEIRGFGSFSLHFRQSRIGINPMTGESVALAPKYAPYFEPGKEFK